MRKDFWVLLFLSVLIFVVWHKALYNFFAQDDFILINHFSQNGFLQNIKNVFGPPTVTHWRPIHNLYFLVSGNIFGKNYIGYHIITFLFHIAASFLIYKVILRLVKNFQAALTSGFIYGIHPAHFVSLFWISGGATIIGFFFLIASFYSHLINKKSLGLVLYILALLASEAMLVGLAIIFVWEILTRRKNWDRISLMNIGIISAVFAVLRFIILTPQITFDVYKMEFSAKIISAIKYYLLRVAGFAEASGDRVVSLILLGWLILLTLFLIKTFNKKRDVYILVLSMAIIVGGLFPFVLIGQHLSPHYMNVSIFGFSILTGLALKQLKPVTSFVILVIFLVIAVYNINLTKNNNWIVKRSNLAKTYLKRIESDKPAYGSTLVFNNNEFSTSEEAYVSLGTGEAIKFWFPEKNYQTCFVVFEACSFPQTK